jgi:hypothetical protein
VPSGRGPFGAGRIRPRYVTPDFAGVNAVAIRRRCGKVSNSGRDVLEVSDIVSRERAPLMPRRASRHSAPRPCSAQTGGPAVSRPPRARGRPLGPRVTGSRWLGWLRRVVGSRSGASRSGLTGRSERRGADPPRVLRSAAIRAKSLTFSVSTIRPLATAAPKASASELPSSLSSETEKMTGL